MTPENPNAAVIQVSNNGPYRVRGAVTIRNSRGENVAAGGPVSLCRCGQSANKPFCDGSHARVGFQGGSEASGEPRPTRTYRGQRVEIHDRRWICAHAAECTSGLPEVWRYGQRPWIEPDAGDVERIVSVVRQCPSGALTVSIDGVDDKEPHATSAPMIHVSKNGPYRVTGAIEFDDPSGARPPVASRFTLCRCGQSKNKPFCDGSHAQGFVDDAS